MDGVTRHYVDVGGRLVHYRRCGSGPPVVLLHESPRSSAVLLPLMAQLDGMTAFALDTPGYGQSEPLPPGRRTLADYADATRDAIAALGLDQPPVYGTHTGASVAYELAVRHPDTCAMLLLDGFPVFTPQEREEAMASYLPPFRPAVDGTHLAWLWSRVRDQTLFFPWYRRGEGARLHKPVPPPDGLHAIALDMLRAGDGYRDAYAGAFLSRPVDTLAALRTPAILGAREDDVLIGHLDRLPALPPDATAARFPADRAAAYAAMGAQMLRAAHGTAPDLADAALPLDQPGTTYVGMPGGELHVRGSLGGSGLPLLLIHALPGGSGDFAALLSHLAGHRPVLAPDLPGAGESDVLDPSTPDAVLDVLDAACTHFGLTAMEVAGEGTGTILATALHHRDPQRWQLSPGLDEPSAEAIPPDFRQFRPHPVGAHLLAAWHHVRDAAILGPWWNPAAPGFAHLDADDLQARTVEILKARGDHTDLLAALLRRPAN